MNLNRAELKREARQSLRTQHPSPYLVTLLFLLLIWVLEILSVKLLYPGENLMEIAQHYIASAEAQATLPATPASFREMLDRAMEMQSVAEPASGFGRLLDIALDIMTLMLTTGFTLFCLNVSRGAAAGPGNLLDAFGIFFKVLLLSILTGIFTALWSILFIIPGIIAYYRYSFAVYILLDNPEKGVMQCIRESCALTAGHKWQLFVLDLSFLGWIILSIVPFVALYTMPYMTVTWANYYCRISGRTEAPVEIPPDQYSVDE